jgi:methionyl-tRNA formyltransferase
VIVFTDMPQIVGAYAQMLPAAGHQLVGVVTSRKRNRAFVDVVSSVPAETDVLVSDRPRRWAAMLAPLRPDLIISTVFPHRLPQALIDVPRLGAINIHPSLLPKYRGTMTPNWTLLNGERQAGVTVHRMSTEFDTGPILAQAPIEVSDEDDLTSYMQRLFAQTPAVFFTALGKVIAGDPGEPQDESEATYFGVIPDELRVIDWSSPATRIYNQIRGLAGLIDPPGALGTVDGVQSRIFKARLMPDAGGDGHQPGSVIDRLADGVVIQCGDGAIQLLYHEPVETA